jgi:hypothetical protein
MKRLINHSWLKQDGFRTHICIHCGIIRYWDDSFKKLIYKTKYKIWYYNMPECKRTYLCDKVEMQLPANIQKSIYNHNRKI